MPCKGRRGARGGSKDFSRRVKLAGSVVRSASSASPGRCPFGKVRGRTGIEAGHHALRASPYSRIMHSAAWPRPSWATGARDRRVDPAPRRGVGGRGSGGGFWCPRKAPGWQPTSEGDGTSRIANFQGRRRGKKQAAKARATRVAEGGDIGQAKSRVRRGEAQALGGRGWPAF